MGPAGTREDRGRLPVFTARSPGRLLGPVALTISGLGLPALAAAWCTDPIAAAVSALAGGGPVGSTSLDLLVNALAAVGLAVCAAWLALVLVATAFEAVTGLSCTAVRAVTPALLRRTALVTCGVAVAGAGALGPAAATTPEAEDQSAIVGPAITGLPLPDRATGAPATARAARGSARPPRAHLVRPGESLWSIAESLTPPGSGTAEIAAACRRLYGANATVVGPDPDLILPGTTLLVPERRPAGEHAGPPTRHRKDAS